MSEEISIQHKWTIKKNTFYYCVPNEPILKVHPIRKEDNIFRISDSCLLLCLFFNGTEIKPLVLSKGDLYSVPDSLRDHRNLMLGEYFHNMETTLNIESLISRVNYTEQHYDSTFNYVLLS